MLTRKKTISIVFIITLLMLTLTSCGKPDIGFESLSMDIPAGFENTNEVKDKTGKITESTYETEAAVIWMTLVGEGDIEEFIKSNSPTSEPETFGNNTIYVEKGLDEPLKSSTISCYFQLGRNIGQIDIAKIDGSKLTKEEKTQFNDMLANIQETEE